MESLNNIELQGVIGTCKITPVNGTRVARFTLATDNTYTSKDGSMIIDTTWFNCTAWESSKINCLDKLGRGGKVHILGRVRMQRYTDASGSTREIWEIVAQELKLVEG